MRRLILFWLLAAAAAAPARADTILWPATTHVYSVPAPAGWGHNQTDDGVNLQIYPPDKSCSVVVSYLKNDQYIGRSTDSLAAEIAAKAGVANFAAAGPGTISGIKGETFTATLQNATTNSTWDARFLWVQLRPYFWAIEIIKWPQSATPAQQAACNAAAAAVTLIYH